MALQFRGTVIEWRGPAPFYFVPVAAAVAEDIHDVSSMATYGWGCIPTDVTIGATTWYTALFPKDDGYLVPIKAAIRKAEHIELGDAVDVTLDLRFNPDALMP